ncbi:MAG TPA: hypothetical protein VK187_14360 [Geobacteraceae bacterium]|nr:hypothetical protein [Geobacteraceae bacterium]
MGNNAVGDFARWASYFLPVAMLVVLSGCSSMTVVEDWKNQNAAPRHYKKLMILGIAHDENLRRTVESILVDEMGRNGVMAVASHTLVKDIDNAKRDDVVTAVRSAGADAVLTIRGISKGDTTVSRSGETGGIYGTAMNTGGTALQSAKSYSLATLQTNLYDSTTAELVWSATIKTYDAKNEARVSRDLGRFFVERLRRDGLL